MITRIIYKTEFFQGSDTRGFFVGDDEREIKNGYCVKSITCHPAQSEGDKWYWTIEFHGGNFLDVYYPLEVYYNKAVGK